MRRRRLLEPFEAGIGPEISGAVVGAQGGLPRGAETLLDRAGEAQVVRTEIAGVLERIGGSGHPDHSLVAPLLPFVAPAGAQPVHVPVGIGRDATDEREIEEAVVVPEAEIRVV